MGRTSSKELLKVTTITIKMPKDWIDYAIELTNTYLACILKIRQTGQKNDIEICYLNCVSIIANSLQLECTQMPSRPIYRNRMEFIFPFSGYWHIKFRINLRPICIAQRSLPRLIFTGFYSIRDDDSIWIRYILIEILGDSHWHIRPFRFDGKHSFILSDECVVFAFYVFVNQDVLRF